MRLSENTLIVACGIIITGDFNQLNDNFLKTHYRFVQIVNVGTRGNAVLDKMWTNMDNVYMSPVTLSELGTSDHNMVLLKPGSRLPRSTDACHHTGHGRE